MTPSRTRFRPARLPIALALCLLALLPARGAAQGARTAPSPWTLWYTAPAREWVEALPVGNGFLGAMVFGGTARERIQFNESTIWTGGPHDYARKGASEVTSTVISMSLSLVAVFIPILFMGGIVGRLFREFAVVLSASIAVSLVVSLTVTPTMCARLLSHKKGERQPGRISRGIEWCFTALQNAYTRTLDVALTHRWLTLLVLLGTVALTAWQYVTIPKGFFPQQDTGQMRGNISGDQSISFVAMKEKVIEMAEIIRQDPAIESVNASTGGGGPGYQLKNEADKNTHKHHPGTLAMARTSDPNSATSQFFINHGDNDFLNYPGQDGYGYAVFGKVTSGLDVVDKIAETPTGNARPFGRDVPVTQVVIDKVTVL